MKIEILKTSIHVISLIFRQTRNEFRDRTSLLVLLRTSHCDHTVLNARRNIEKTLSWTQEDMLLKHEFNQRN